MTFEDKLDNWNTEKNKSIIEEFLNECSLLNKEIKEISNEMLRDKLLNYVKKYFVTRFELTEFLIEFLDGECSFDVKSGLYKKNKKLFDLNELPFEILRATQGEECMTRDNINAKYYRTGNDIGKLIPEMEGDTYRLYGNAIKLYKPISVEDEKKKYIDNTITPVVLGLTQGEIYYIIKCLLKNDEFVDIGEHIASRFYNQLGKYGREQVKEGIERDKKSGEIKSKIVFKDDLYSRMQIESEIIDNVERYILRDRKSGNYIDLEEEQGKEYKILKEGELYIYYEDENGKPQLALKQRNTT